MMIDVHIIMSVHDIIIITSTIIDLLILVRKIKKYLSQMY